MLIAIYTMLGAEHSASIWYQPILLLSGAAWYYLLSLIWQSFWPMQPVQNSLAETFKTLATYIDTKSKLFHPVQRLNPQPMRIAAAKQNANTVAALELCRQTLLKRSNRGHVDGPSDRFLRIYFIVQDIHERLSSSHYRYQELASHFERSDVLFRFKHLLQAYASECRSIGRALQLGIPFERSQDTTLALDELQASMTALREQNNPVWKDSLSQLQFLFNNLCTVDQLFNNINNPDASNAENHLDDRTAHTAGQMWQNVRSAMTIKSQLFRHAVRMSLALTIGYGIIEVFSIEHGFWILLTTLFVCQPNFSATKQKLFHRIGGTLVGLVAGVLLLNLIPEVEGQLFVIVISSVLFFAFRIQNYAYATTFITILVLFLFSQLGIGYAVILPRLVDTLIGSALAVGAVYFVLPDWQAKKIPQFMASAIRANKEYLGQIISQYRLGKSDDLAYRIARRAAHNNDAQLSAAITNMLAEPGKYRGSSDLSFRVLTLNHALLSYISALVHTALVSMMRQRTN
ncbi:putative efflux family inner membrane protein yccS [Vibrio ishigakensis]|uniref:Putative efflux family inner membrane protein yccS n=1 Tax=Vibrio ishigakensis TaxID=1481914 RepID=A0A0B8PNW4_9VIBR|nr:putative efflux family inner membrane protein yccS [Vibrio ishigakensis]